MLKKLDHFYETSTKMLGDLTDVRGLADDLAATSTYLNAVTIGGDAVIALTNSNTLGADVTD